MQQTNTRYHNNASERRWLRSVLRLSLGILQVYLSMFLCSFFRSTFFQRNFEHGELSKSYTGRKSPTWWSDTLSMIPLLAAWVFRFSWAIIRHNRMLCWNELWKIPFSNHLMQNYGHENSKVFKIQLLTHSFVEKTPQSCQVHLSQLRLPSSAHKLSKYIYFTGLLRFFLFNKHYRQKKWVCIASSVFLLVGE